MSHILFLILLSLNSCELTTKDPGHATLQMWSSQTHWFLQGGHARADVSVPSSSWSWRGSWRSFTSYEAHSRRPLLWRREGDKVSPVSWVVLSCSKGLQTPFDTGLQGTAWVTWRNPQIWGLERSPAPLHSLKGTHFYSALVPRVVSY